MNHHCEPDERGDYCQSCGGRLNPEPEPRTSEPVLSDRDAREKAYRFMRAKGYTNVQYLQDEAG